MILKHLGVVFSVKFVSVLEKQTFLKGNCHLVLDSLFWNRAADSFIFPGSKCCLLYVESRQDVLPACQGAQCYLTSELSWLLLVTNTAFV